MNCWRAGGLLLLVFRMCRGCGPSVDAGQFSATRYAAIIHVCGWRTTDAGVLQPEKV
jgi:hypothetical protein